MAGHPHQSNVLSKPTASRRLDVSASKGLSAGHPHQSNVLSKSTARRRLDVDASFDSPCGRFQRAESSLMTGRRTSEQILTRLERTECPRCILASSMTTMASSSNVLHLHRSLRRRHAVRRPNQGSRCAGTDSQQWEGWEVHGNPEASPYGLCGGTRFG